MVKVDPTDLVAEFHKIYDVPIRSKPLLKIPERQLRVDLLKEETQEYEEAEKEGSLVQMADALGDIVYVAYGAALAHGIDLSAVLLEIHRSNMSKLGADGKPMCRNDGKVMKGPNYSPPDIEKVLYDSN